MNTPLRRVGLAMLGMVVLLLANITYIQMVKADEYRADARNQRVRFDEYSRERGKIISSDGKLLASVTPTNDSLRYQRQYPLGAAFAPVTGFYSIRYGPAALERTEKDILDGSDDRLFVRRLSDLITGRDPRGGNVQTTIDSRVQQAAYDAMTQPGTGAAYTGAVVAIRPQTGEILAMVSTPSYDPNPLASHSGDEQAAAWTAYDKDKTRPMVNRAIQDTYPPGSTFKLVVSAAALEDGMNKDTQLTAANTVQLPGTRTDLENFNGGHCGPNDQQTASLETALALSCNTAFATLADQLGPDKLREQAAKFGVGQTDLKIPMGVEESHIGPMPDKAAVYQTGIGQRDVRLTPMQDAMVVAAIANGGTLMRPQLVQKVLAPDLSEMSKFDVDEIGKAMSGSNASALRDMMKKSEENTKGNGKVNGLVIASKTGTAEHGKDPKATPPHAWYVAFAPADNPQIAVAVIVESGGNRGLAATGGSVAASVGRAAINALPGIGGR
ncbi:peptidoglycan D,D-transpeptidase FtsI family protein [Kibdelosporangium phytohabitans]|uniref:Penicillin-binding protein n=1 Tax=Kibdelosporangium phytohabitans TaxID=860235 RepID=A0A0N9HRA1_9PSEU|nr:penicillin-binding protein 2 [Kibdelosporangium phytohabitans]ALG05549.1 penicillin-binding protein [Kibdelosporangium phytohabitans]MBE1466492.1 peptidoglycan glycosyltransferase [Kibdelosporangium phytohabitans]